MNDRQGEEIDVATALNFLHGATIRDASAYDSPRITEGTVLRLELDSEYTIEINGTTPREDADLAFRIQDEA